MMFSGFIWYMYMIYVFQVYSDNHPSVAAVEKHLAMLYKKMVSLAWGSNTCFDTVHKKLFLLLKILVPI